MKQVSVRLEDGLYQKLRVRLLEEGLTFSEFVRDRCGEYIGYTTASSLSKHVKKAIKIESYKGSNVEGQKKSSKRRLSRCLSEIAHISGTCDC